MEIFDVTGQVVITLQDNCELIAKTAANVFERKECDEEKIKEFIKSVPNCFIKYIDKNQVRDFDKIGGSVIHVLDISNIEKDESVFI